MTIPYRDPSPIDGPVGADLWERADRALPGGGVYFTRSADMSGRGVLPGFIAANDGCRVTDVDGREYIDFLGANGPNILGYRHPEVEAAADDMRSRITTASLFPPSLVEVVERLLQTWSTMGWGLVAKSGSEVVTLGGRVARQHTQRPSLVAFEHSYHGNDPELASGPPTGPLTTLTDDVIRLPWNDPQRLIDYFEIHGADIAGIILNPLDQRPLVQTTEPTAEFLAAIEQVRERWGALVVLDDVRHGFRLHPSGSHRQLGIEPDLIALGKALGNGHSISALLGTEELRTAARKIMFTSTYMFVAPPMAAAAAMALVLPNLPRRPRLCRVGVTNESPRILSARPVVPPDTEVRTAMPRPTIAAVKTTQSTVTAPSSSRLKFCANLNSFICSSNFRLLSSILLTGPSLPTRLFGLPLWMTL